MSNKIINRYEDVDVRECFLQVDEFGKGFKSFAFEDDARGKDIAGALRRNGTYFPDIVKVTTNTKTEDDKAVLGPDGQPTRDKNGNVVRVKTKLETPVYTTIVDFADSTRVIVKCSDKDTPNVETAICNAIVKRLVGKPVKGGNGLYTGEVDATGCGSWLRKVAAAAYDQSKKDEVTAATKAERKEKRAVEQKALHDEAVKRRARRRADELEVLMEALKMLGIQTTAKCGKTESGKTESGKTENGCDPYPYVKPDKKFKDFTQAEKREYWREQKRRTRD